MTTQAATEAEAATLHLAFDLGPLATTATLSKHAAAVDSLASLAAHASAALVRLQNPLRNPWADRLTAVGLPAPLPEQEWVASSVPSTSDRYLFYLSLLSDADISDEERSARYKPQWRLSAPILDAVARSIAPLDNLRVTAIDYHNPATWQFVGVLIWPLSKIMKAIREWQLSGQSVRRERLTNDLLEHFVTRETQRPIDYADAAQQIASMEILLALVAPLTAGTSVSSASVALAIPSEIRDAAADAVETLPEITQVEIDPDAA